MSNKEEIKLCPNCEELIPINTFILHERMCTINIKKCEKCNKPINIEDLEEHNKEFHNDKECEFCKRKFSNEDIKTHSNNCNYQMVECKYCKMLISKIDLSEHEYVCGSKTEICDICKQIIKMKDLINHKKIGCYSPDDDLLNKKIVI